MHRRRLNIVNPCTEDFDAMRGAGASRHCEKCDKSVTDLSAMTELQARAFLRARAGARVCVRYRTTADGAIRFRSPPPMAGRAAAVLSMALAGCAGYADTAPIDAPTEVEACEDVAGYTIPCADAPADVRPPAETVAPVETVAPTEPTEPTEPTVQPPEGADVWMGQAPLPTGAGCPIPAPDPSAVDEPEILMGDIDPEYAIQGELEAPASLRAMRRQERRERRRERRDRRRHG